MTAGREGWNGRGGRVLGFGNAFGYARAMPSIPRWERGSPSEISRARRYHPVMISVNGSVLRYSPPARNRPARRAGYRSVHRR